MKTAEELYEMSKQNGYQYRLSKEGKINDFESISRNLDENDKVVLSFYGGIANRYRDERPYSCNGAFVLTNRGIMVGEYSDGKFMTLNHSTQRCEENDDLSYHCERVHIAEIKEVNYIKRDTITGFNHIGEKSEISIETVEIVTKGKRDNIILYPTKINVAEKIVRHIKNEMLNFKWRDYE